MERWVAIGCFSSVAFCFVVMSIGGLISWSITRQNAPWLKAHTAARTNQRAILSSGTLDQAAELESETDRVALLSSLLNPKALDVGGRPLIVECATPIGQRFRMDLRSAGRDARANTRDDVVVMVVFVKLEDGRWVDERLEAIESRGKRWEIDLETGQHRAVR